MGKHNRTNYSGFYNDTPVVEEETIVEEVVDEPVEEHKDIMGKVTAARLYVRQYPNPSGEEITIVDEGQDLMILETLDEWYKVVTPSGAEGYVMKAYVEIV